MRLPAWRKSAQDLSRLHDARDVAFDADLTLAMAELWLLVRDAPADLAVHYRGISQQVLEETARQARDALDVGRLTWRYDIDWDDLALSIGGQLLALDQALADRPGFANPRSHPAAYLCEEVDVFVIPYLTGKPDDRPVGPGSGFGRRGTPHHRILPRQIGTSRIELRREPKLLSVALAGSERLGGAALFPGMELKRDPDATDWVAGTADCASEADHIKAQLDGAYSGGVFAAVWPELSMPPGRLERLSRAAYARGARMSEGAPAILAAGSWHERRDGQMRNVMQVLDKMGVVRMEYWKGSTYVRGEIQEGIIPADTIPVLISADALVTFAICLDFCEREVAQRYLELDVDLILVCSVGNLTTMKGHEAKAGDIRTVWGASAFVTQHNDVMEDPLGYVFPPENENGTLAEERVWSVRKLHFS
jgi:hypothetical protein